LLENATAMGTLIMDGLRRELAGLPGVVDVRGTGLMIGIEMAQPCPDVVARGLQAGLVVNVTADSVVRLLPPLIFSREQAELTVATLAPILREAAQRPAARAA
jgi:acetylornithine aminotransferase